MGRPVLRETDPNSLFSMVYFYTLRCYAKVTWGQQSWLLSKSGASYKCIQRSWGVTSSSGQGACWQFMTLSLWQRSVNQDTYFSRGSSQPGHGYPWIWMDKKAVVQIHNGVLLSHEKEYIWISSNEVDETGACYTEWSKPERKTPIQYTNAYIWNLERW